MAGLLLACSTAGMTGPGPESSGAMTQRRKAAARGERASAEPSEAGCFVDLPGAAVVYAEEPPDIVVLTYSTAQNDIGSLRILVHRFAERQDRGGAKADPGVAPATDPRVGISTSLLVPPGVRVLVPQAHAAAEDTETGARLVLAPVPPAVRKLLQQDLEARRARASTGQCPPAQELTSTPGT
jgi:hypothetical protein